MVRIQFCKISVLLFTVLAWPFAAHAAKEKAPAQLFVQSAPCAGGGSELRKTALATPVRFASGKTFLVAQAPDFPAGTKMCFRAKGAGNEATVQLLRIDYQIGLAVYTLPSQLKAQPFEVKVPVERGSHLTNEEEDRANKEAERVLGLRDLAQARGMAVRLQPSKRNYVYADFEMLEVAPFDKSTNELLHSAGAPITNNNELVAILSDQTIVLLPGQPARAYRERDLPLIGLPTLHYYRLAFAPHELAEWIESGKFGWRSGSLELLSMPTTKNGVRKTRWRLMGLEILETCYRAGHAAGDDNIPVGGIEPVGVGGLEDALSTCRIDIPKGQKVKKTESGSFNALVETQSQATGTRLFVAYQRPHDSWSTFKVDSIQNVHHLFSQITSRGMSFLIDDDFFRDSKDSAKLLMREKAYAAQNAVTEFYKKQYGNPLVLRLAFFFAAGLRSRKWEEIGWHWGRFSGMLDDELPLSLRELDLERKPEETLFHQNKEKLLKSIQELENARHRINYPNGDQGGG